MGNDQLAMFGGRPLVRRSRTVTDRAIKELRRRGRLEPIHVGQVGMLRTVADLLDLEAASPERSAWTMARLVTEWRALWDTISGRADAGFDEELRAFFDSTGHDSDPPVRDPT